MKQKILAFLVALFIVIAMAIVSFYTLDALANRIAPQTTLVFPLPYEMSDLQFSNDSTIGGELKQAQAAIPFEDVDHSCIVVDTIENYACDDGAGVLIDGRTYDEVMALTVFTNTTTAFDGETTTPPAYYAAYILSALWDGNGATLTVATTNPNGCAEIILALADLSLYGWSNVASSARVTYVMGCDYVELYADVLWGGASWRITSITWLNLGDFDNVVDSTRGG